MSSPKPHLYVACAMKHCCHKCEDAALATLSFAKQLLERTFIVCATCGNKRCPKASDHEFACTNSNEPGQPGSIYQ